MSSICGQAEGRRGRQCPAQRGPLPGPQVLSRLSAGKGCRQAWGLTAGAQRCLYLTSGRLGSRAASQVLAGPLRPGQRAQSQVLLREGPGNMAPAPYPGPWTLPFLIPPSVDHCASLQLRPASLVSSPAERAGLAATSRVLGTGSPAWPGAPGEGLPLNLACRRRVPACLLFPGGRWPRLLESATWPSSCTSCPHRAASPLLSAGHSCDCPPVGVPRVHRHATLGPGLGGPRAVGWAGSGTLCSSAI